MSDTVWLALISLVVLIINTWRTEVAAQRGAANNKAAEILGENAVLARKEQSAAIEQVHQAVNGGMAAAKNEIVSLKAQLVVAKLSEPEVPPEEKPTPVQIVNPDPIPVTPVGARLEEIHGESK